MKPLFLITAFFMMITSSKNSEGQTYNDVAFNDSNSPLNFKPFPPAKKKHKARAKSVNEAALNNFIRSGKIVAETKAPNVNINAVRHFIRSYKNISDPKWFQTEGGYIASFHSKGIFSKIVYDMEGNWFYNLLEYTEANMGFEIRDMVMSKYYDNDILIVHEYQFKKDKTVYIIRMVDKQFDIVTLKVCDGEIEVISKKN
jgi:hypothetical protein